jgi:hypothetical protein
MYEERNTRTCFCAVRYYAPVRSYAYARDNKDVRREEEKEGENDEMRTWRIIILDDMRAKHVGGVHCGHADIWDGSKC